MILAVGTYRLLLAIAVLLSHAGAYLGPYNQGVIAVVSFFVISGYVTTALIQRHYPTVGAAAQFYLDRAMRLFPQYLAYLLGMIVVIWFAAGRFGWPELSPAAIGLNSLMIPVGFYMYAPIATPLNPPTWTLGLEATFYLVMPFLLLLKRRRLAFVASGAVFLAAFLGWLQPDIYGYRLLPGTLFIFLCGSFLRTGERLRWLIAAWLLSAVLFAATLTYAQFRVPYNAEMLLGVLIGLPAVALLARIESGAIDVSLGNLSYGVYLNHFALLWGAQAAGHPIETWGDRGLLLIASMALSFATYRWIERPVVKLCHRLRTQPALIDTETAPAAHAARSG